MPYPRLLAIGLLTGSLLCGGYAWSQVSNGAPSPVPVDPAPVLTMPALLEKLQAQGYRDPSAIERKGDKLIEVKATDSDGRRMELYVDARSGEILKAERD